MKRLSAILLSFVLVYAGVAQALAACLELQEHGHRVSTGTDENSPHHHAATREPDSRGSAVPDFHCPDLHLYSDAVSGTSMAERLSFAGKMRLITSRGDGGLTRVPTDLWLRAVFWRVASFDPSSDRSRHIFLSVFRI